MKIQICSKQFLLHVAVIHHVFVCLGKKGLMCGKVSELTLVWMLSAYEGETPVPRGEHVARTRCDVQQEKYVDFDV
jgi:hypothetical protein